MIQTVTFFILRMFLKILDLETPSLNRGNVLQKAKHDTRNLRVLGSIITLETSLAYNAPSYRCLTRIDLLYVAISLLFLSAPLPYSSP
jgi:hypothetical protein